MYIYLTNDYFSIFIRNPFETWWKARKYFRFPSISLHFFTNIIHNCPYASYNNVAKILDIRCVDVLWKDKYDTPRHERNPYLWVCFFKKFGFSINSNILYTEDGKLRDGSTFYWEYLLDYLYYRKDINKVAKWTTWNAEKGQRVIPIREFSLKKKWLNTNTLIQTSKN